MIHRTIVLLCVVAVFLIGSLLWSEDEGTDAFTPSPHETKEMLKQFWQDTYSVPDMHPSSSLMVELLGKAVPDECYYGIGDERNEFSPGLDPDSCRAQGGIPKVNQSYVWGLTKSGHHIWFGTITNNNCVVRGSFLQDTDPTENEYQVCEYGESQFSPPLPENVGDWRPSQIFVYDLQEKKLIEKTPTEDLLLMTTTGIRSAGSLGEVVIMGGPGLGGMPGVNLFAFHAVTQE